MGGLSLPVKDEPALYSEEKKVQATEANTRPMLTSLAEQVMCQPWWQILTPLLRV